MKRLGMLVLCGLLFVPASQAAELSLAEMFKRISPSVGALYSRGFDGGLSFNCTITAVERNGGRLTLLTANHCVSKGVAYLVTFNGNQFFAAHVWKLPPEAVHAQYKRPYGQPETDAALFWTEDIPDIPVVPLGDDAKVEAGQRVIVIGYPLGVTKVRYEGIISGRLETPGADLNGYLILQSFGAPGSSGTAVIDQGTGQVIGVLVAARSAGVGLPVIFVTPISYRRFLVEANKERNHQADRTDFYAE